MSESLRLQWLDRVALAPGPLTVKQLRKHLEVRPQEEAEFGRWLDWALKKGKLVRNRYGRYAPPEDFNLLVGRLEVNPRGFAFLPAGEGPDIYVAPGDKGGAVHGDTVLVRPQASGKTRRGQNPEGVVLRVLERAHRRLVGELSWRGRYGLVIPDDRRLTDPVVVAPPERQGAKSGEKVLVEILRWAEARSLPEGRVLERLGMPDSPGTQERALLARYSLDPSFPPEVEEEASRMKEPGEDPEENRLDLTHLEVVAIDPPGARDFDDALSLEKTETGFRVGVHIADVAHYVPAGGFIDKEAKRRGTSVYLVEQAVPMLPRRLSEDLCSLREGVERYALSALIDYDRRGQYLGFSLEKTIIRISANLTYEEVQKVIAGDQREHPQAALILDLHELSMKLWKDRVARGSIDFDLPESEIVVDEMGRPLDIRPRHSDESHRLVESFMLAANQAVAARYRDLGYPFMYRVHPEPAGEKLEQAADFLKILGLHLEVSQPMHPHRFQELLGKVRDHPQERLVNMVLLRSLPLAHYSHQCLGHFALALGEYCHFTSPIRRYPDLLVHRVITRHLREGHISRDVEAIWRREMPQLADACSDSERLAEEVEREAKDIKKAQYMRDRVGDIFRGTISGVTEFGFFVELSNGVEGLVHVSSLDDDYYLFAQDRYMLTGKRKGRAFRLGDQVKVQVTRASVAERRVDFRLAGPPDSP